MKLSVLLDNVRSKNNIGSIFRTSDALGVEKIYLCGISATPPDRDIHKTALGAEESVPFAYHRDIHAALDLLRADGYCICAVEQTADSLELGSGRWPAALGQRVALVFGNELDGVQPSVLERCDAALEIPQCGIKKSLNVSCAAAIALWEITKHLRQ